MTTDLATTLQGIRERADKWLADPNSLNRAAVEEMRWDLDWLEYLVTPKLTAQIAARPNIKNPICAEPGCKADWRIGLINYANAGFDPVWYCTEHKKVMEHTHHPPGTAEPKKPLLQKAEEMAHRWAQFLEVLKRPPVDPFMDKSS